jgi:hypothetical protein
MMRQQLESDKINNCAFYTSLARGLTGNTDDMGYACNRATERFDE